MEKSNDKYARIMQEVEQRIHHHHIIDGAEKKTQLVFFTLAKVSFAFYGPHVQEIVPITPITEIPGSSSLFLGVVNVRGTIHSVLHLHKLLGLPECAMTPASRIAIAVYEGIRTGILMDSVDDITDLPVRSIHPNVDHLGNPMRGLSSGQITHANQLTTVLEMSRIYEMLQEKSQ